MSDEDLLCTCGHPLSRHREEMPPAPCLAPGCKCELFTEPSPLRVAGWEQLQEAIGRGLGRLEIADTLLPRLLAAMRLADLAVAARDYLTTQEDYLDVPDGEHPIAKLDAAIAAYLAQIAGM